VNKHVEAFEAYFNTKFNHFTIHDRTIIRELLKELKKPDITSVTFRSSAFGNRYNAIEVSVFFKTKRRETERCFYIDDTTFWRDTGRNVFETIGNLDATGKFADVDNPQLLEVLFGVMHMGDDNVDDAVFNYQLRDDKLVQSTLSRYKGLVKVRWPK